MVQNSPRATTAPGHSDSATPPSTASSGLDRFFEITKRGSTVATEIRGGLVTFFAMAYIIALNPLIIGATPDIDGRLVSGYTPTLSETGSVVMDDGVLASMAMVAAATALIGGLMTILMGVVGRYPIGIATGLGINAMMAASIVQSMTWAQAMGLVVWEGVIITILVLTGFRKAVFRAVPRVLRTSISVGIGLFVALVGLINAGVIRKPSGGGTTPVQLGVDGSLVGWPVLVFVVGLGLVIWLYLRRVKGAMLIAIAGATVLAVIIEAITHIGSSATYGPTGWSLNVPTLAGVTWSMPDLGLLFNVDLFGAFAGGPEAILLVLLTIFALLLADFFDTMGTVVAIGQEGGMLDSQGDPPRLQQILLVDSIAAIAGGLGSVSSNTSYIESASGVGEGARTGLASIVTGALFLLSVFLAPIVNIIPSEAVAPVLFFVGFLMMTQITEIDWNDLELAIPAFATLAFMPFSYSITVGIGVGFLLYVFIKTVRGKARQVHPLLWVVAALFLVYFVQGALLSLF
ncbi:MAG: NCS2 family permease [Propionibacteriaceae bacterium]|jgi:AGZA family xanthine/uracil permease-like MFS transporter|nr:NCS2 family permease [Propionibacteriaceae bacterium]